MQECLGVAVKCSVPCLATGLLREVEETARQTLRRKGLPFTELLPLPKPPS